MRAGIAQNSFQVGVYDLPRMCFVMAWNAQDGFQTGEDCPTVRDVFHAGVLIADCCEYRL